MSVTVSKPQHHVNLNKGTQLDLTLWHEFLMVWNGVSMMVYFLDESEPDIV